MFNWLNVNYSDQFVTFLKSEYASFVKQAAEETGYAVYVGRRTRPHGYVEIRTSETRDLSSFWNRYAELRDAKNV